MSNADQKKPSYTQWFEGKSVLITGATSGIGREMSRKLAACGAKLVLCGQNRQAMQALIEESMAKKHSTPACFFADLSHPEEVDRLVREVKHDHDIDVLINNAGSGYIDDFCKMPKGSIHAMNQLNMLTVAELCRTFLPRMREKPGSGVMNIGSVASFFATPGSALYGATKHFILGFTDALHQEMLVFGVHVTGVYPGNTYSRFLERSTEGKRKAWEQAMSPVYVAEKALEGLSRNAIRVVPGAGNKAKLLIANMMPVSMRSRAIYNNSRRMNEE